MQAAQHDDDDDDDDDIYTGSGYSYFYFHLYYCTLSIPDRVIPKAQKRVLDAALLNTQHSMVRIKGKVKQSRLMSSAVPRRKCPWCNGYRRRKWTRVSYPTRAEEVNRSRAVSYTSV